MHEHDLHGRALLVIVGRAGDLSQNPKAKRERGRTPTSHGRMRSTKRQELRRIGVGRSGPSAGLSIDGSRSRTMRHASACNVSTDLWSRYGSFRIANHSCPARKCHCRGKWSNHKADISDSAHRIVNGVPKRTGPTIAAFEAATPKISTGMASGRTSTRQQQSAAPQRDGHRRADQSEEGQRRRAGEQRRGDGAGRGDDRD